VTSVSTDAPEICERTIAHVFHALSQPLTALQCSLELSLARDESAEEFRASVESALQNAERLRQTLLLLRELSDADDPGDISAPVQLCELLQDLREDFLLVFESAGGGFDLTCAPVHIRGNGDKLRRALFYLLESELRTPRYRSLKVEVAPTQEQAAIRMTFFGPAAPPISPDEASEHAPAGEIEIARRTFRAVGGDLIQIEFSSEQSLWLASLPLAD